MKRHTIETKTGCYTGVVEPSGVISFRGIPFADPPVGKLRWQPPQPVSTYDSVRTVDLYPPAPVQQNYPKHLADMMHEPLHIPISEDCLYLNVWAADLDTPKKGVLVWVFGGSYAIGHASRIESRGERFVAAHPEILFVSANYRLGVFGSIDLSVLEGGASASPLSNNLNLLDQRAALSWVRDNASAFNADPDTITLYGHSAGSNAICHHLASNESGKLFARAICQSSFLQGPPPRTLDQARADAQKIFDYLDVHTLDAALNLSAARLLEAQAAVFGEIYGSPVLDELTLPKDEFGALLNGSAAGKEIMMGYANGERDGRLAGMDPDAAVGKVIADNKKFLNGDSKPIEEFLRRHGDMPKQQAAMTAQAELAMLIPADIQARALAKHSKVYQYEFCWADASTGIRAPHGAPNPFVFGTDIPESAPKDLERQMQNTWASFIASGDPNNSDIPRWNAYTEHGGTVMTIDSKWKAVDGFWDTDYPIFAPLFEDSKRLED
jgi:para-nitrobenzyl esterase